MSSANAPSTPTLCTANSTTNPDIGNPATFSTVFCGTGSAGTNGSFTGQHGNAHAECSLCFGRNSTGTPTPNNSANPGCYSWTSEPASLWPVTTGAASKQPGDSSITIQRYCSASTLHQPVLPWLQGWLRFISATITRPAPISTTNTGTFAAATAGPIAKTGRWRKHGCHG